MANAKYNNLVPLMAAGGLSWARDKILAVLYSGLTFDATDVRLQDVAGTEKARVEIPGRSIGPTGSLLGSPASFGAAAANVNYAVVLAKDDGTGNPLVLSFYNVNDVGGPIKVTTGGTLLVRPQGSTDSTPGTWVGF